MKLPGPGVLLNKWLRQHGFVLPGCSTGLFRCPLQPLKALKDACAIRAQRPCCVLAARPVTPCRLPAVVRTHQCWTPVPVYAQPVVAAHIQAQGTRQILRNTVGAGHRRRQADIPKTNHWTV